MSRMLRESAPAARAANNARHLLEHASESAPRKMEFPGRRGQFSHAGGSCRGGSGFSSMGAIMHSMQARPPRPTVLWAERERPRRSLAINGLPPAAAQHSPAPHEAADAAAKGMRQFEALASSRTAKAQRQL